MEAELEARFLRDINCLREKDKNTRINSLKRIQQSLFKENPDSIKALFSYKLKSPLLDLLKDPADKCKELSIDILSNLSKNSLIPHEEIPALITSLHSRLGVDPCQETCEEVRIVEINLLQTVLEKYTICIQPVISEVTDILARLGKDRCPQVKNSVSNGIVFLVKSGMRFGSKKLLDGVRDNCNHQQFKVRCLALEAIGSLCLHDSGIAEELYPEFKKSQLDRRQEVRIQAYSVLTEILLYLNYQDLIKIESKFVYLLLGGLCDEDCSEKVKNWLLQVSQRIFAVSKDFNQNDSDTFGDDWLIVRNIKVLIETSLADIQEWTIQDLYRSRAVGNIKHIVTLGKYNVHPFIEKVLKVFFIAYGGSNDAKYSETLENVVCCIAGCCELSVVIKAYEKLMQDPASVQEKCAGLKLLSRVVQGVKADVESLTQIVDFLFIKDFVSDYSLHTSLVQPVYSVIFVFQVQCKMFMHELFYILLTLENTLKDQISQPVALLAEYCGYTDISELYGLELPITLPKIIQNYHQWDSECFERTQFRNLITRAGSSISEYWLEILSVFKENCALSKESEVRYDMLATFEHLTKNPNLSSILYNSSETVLLNILTPTCAWKVGASSIQIRISSLVCLNNLLKVKLLNPGSINKNWGVFFNAFSGCLDEDWDSELRLASIQCVLSIVREYISELNDKPIEELLRETIKRLDDSVDTIRVLCTFPITGMYKELARRDLSMERVEKDVRMMLLHLDDENKDLREGVFAVLEEVVQWKKEMVVGIFREKRDKQRNFEIIDKFLMKYGE